MPIKIADLDPFPLDPVAKFEHMFEEGQRVRVKETGHWGKLQVINRGGGHVVRLDSGHVIQARDFEIEPEDFHTAPRSMAASEKAFALFDDAEILKKAEDAMAQRGTVTFAEANCERLEAVQREIDRQKVEERLSDPFGFLQEDSLNNLLLTKRAEKDVQDDLQPIRRQLAPDEDWEFKSGDSVKHKETGRRGKIRGLDYGFATVDYGDDGTAIVICDHLAHVAVRPNQEY